MTRSDYNWKTWTLGGFYLALVALAALTWLSATQFRALLHSNEEWTRSLVVEQKIQELLSSLADAERGQRGYVLTADNDFLRPYQAAVRRMPAAWQTLRDLTKDKPALTPHLEALRQLIDQKMALLQQRIALVKQGDQSAALQSIRSKAGLQLMEGIDAIVAAVQNEQLRATEQLSLRVQSRARNTTLVLAIGSPLGFALLVVIFLCLRREIGLRRRLAEELRRSEERLRTFMDHSPAINFIKTETGHYVYMNSGVTKISDKSPGEWVGKTDFDLWPAEVAQRQRKLDLLAMTENRIVEFNETIVDREGRLRHFMVYKFPIPNQLGSRLLGGVALEITQQKEMEEALQEREKTFRDLVYNAPMGIYLAQEGKFVLVNPGFLRITGYLEEELLGREAMSLVAPEYQELVRHNAIKMLKKQSVIPYEFQAFTRSGERRWVMESVTATQFKGKPATLGYFMDITEPKRMESQFLQAQKMQAVGQLAGGVAHDFNNLLTAIMGLGEIMLLDLSPDEPLHQRTMEIMRTADRAASLTHQLLAFSRKQILQPRILDLNQVVADIDRMLQRILGEHIQVVKSLAPDLGAVKADPAQLQQIILNLAVNARDAMPQGGQLTIETKNVTLDEEYAEHNLEVEAGPYVMLAVSDTGVGMDAETQARVFEPFYTTKEPGVGTGLGLSMVYGIVKQSGGHIKVYSELGQGTTFKVYLPRVEETVKFSDTEEAPAMALQGSETVLVVEDEDLLREVMARSLRLYGYKVLEARQGEEALRLSEDYSKTIHLLVTDVVMPRMNGRELAQSLMRSRPEMKVLYMSGYTENAIVRQGILEPGTVFVQKPFRPVALVAKVREALNKA